MSYATRDPQAWISAQVQNQIDCSKCGKVTVVRGDNDRKIEEACREHAVKCHGGFWRG